MTSSRVAVDIFLWEMSICIQNHPLWFIKNPVILKNYWVAGIIYIFWIYLFFLSRNMWLLIPTSVLLFILKMVSYMSKFICVHFYCYYFLCLNIYFSQIKNIFSWSFLLRYMIHLKYIFGTYCEVETKMHYSLWKFSC